MKTNYIPRANMSPEELEAVRAKERERYIKRAPKIKAKRGEMTPEQRKAYNKKMVDRRNEMLAAMTPEQVREFKDRRYAYFKKHIASLSPEKLAQRKANVREYNQRCKEKKRNIQNEAKE